jgi:hypothetical protein
MHASHVGVEATVSGATAAVVAGVRNTAGTGGTLSSSAVLAGRRLGAGGAADAAIGILGGALNPSGNDELQCAACVRYARARLCRLALCCCFANRRCFCVASADSNCASRRSARHRLQTFRSCGIFRTRPIAFCKRRTTSRVLHATDTPTRCAVEGNKLVDGFVAKMVVV